MTLSITKMIFVALGWALVVSATTLAADVGPRGWVLAGTLALLPAAFIVRFRNRELPSLSQSIEDDLR